MRCVKLITAVYILQSVTNSCYECKTVIFPFRLINSVFLYFEHEHGITTARRLATKRQSGSDRNRPLLQLAGSNNYKAYISTLDLYTLK